MGIAVFWFVGAVVAGIIASSRGRSGFGYFVLSVLLSPLIGIILAAALPNLKLAATVAAAQPSAQSHVRCTQCAELILPEAAVCKHCGAAHKPDLTFHTRAAAQQQADARADSKNLLIGVAFIIGLIALAVFISK